MLLLSLLARPAWPHAILPTLRVMVAPHHLVRMHPRVVAREPPGVLAALAEAEIMAAMAEATAVTAVAEEAVAAMSSDRIYLAVAAVTAELRTPREALEAETAAVAAMQILPKRRSVHRMRAAVAVVKK